MNNDLADLIERVKAATGPDRELDCRLAYALNYEVEMNSTFRSYCDVHDLKWGEIARRADTHQNILRHNLPRFTASIDAALALVERVLPGWQEVRLQVSNPGGEYCNATIIKDTFDQTAERMAIAPAKTAPIAILLALLTALQSQGAS